MWILLMLWWWSFFILLGFFIQKFKIFQLLNQILHYFLQSSCTLLLSFMLIDFLLRLIIIRKKLILAFRATAKISITIVLINIIIEPKYFTNILFCIRISFSIWLLLANWTFCTKKPIFGMLFAIRFSWWRHGLKSICC